MTKHFFLIGGLSLMWAENSQAFHYEVAPVSLQDLSSECVIELGDNWFLSPFQSNSEHCLSERSLRKSWFNGASLGVPIWYSFTEEEDVQCYSLDAQHCVQQPNYNLRKTIDDAQQLSSFNHSIEALAPLFSDAHEVTLKVDDVAWVSSLYLPAQTQQGNRLVLEVNSVSPVQVLMPNGLRKEVGKGRKISWVYLGNDWYEEGTNVHDYPAITALARPLVCGDMHKRIWGHSGYTESGHWCNTLRNTKQAYQHRVLGQSIDTKMASLDQIFSQMERALWQREEDEQHYSERLVELALQRNEKEQARTLTCALVWWNIPGIIACSILSQQYNDLSAAYVALSQERAAQLRKVKEDIDLQRGEHWFQLHQIWQHDDPTHLSALLNEESQTLDELQQLIHSNQQSAEEAHINYEQAIQDYMNETKAENILLRSLEDIPLIGREIDHIMEYSQHRSGKNLRRMLLGLAGPVGEAIEGGVELATEGGSLDPNELAFLRDALIDLHQDHSVGEALEDLVEDVIHSLGDEAIEGIRQAGLWSESKLTGGVTELNHQSLVDLRAQSQQIQYDFWQGETEQEKNVQRKFLFGDSEKDPVVASSQRDSLLTAIFHHAFGGDYAKVGGQDITYDRSNVNQALLEVIAAPAYYEARIPYWVDSSVIGPRPAGMVYDDQHAFIVMNRDLVSPHSTDFYKFYFEELGHLVNWWRCKIFDVALHHCKVAGDAGARFRDAVMLDETQHTRSFNALLFELPTYSDTHTQTLRFNNNHFATLEGWPNYYTINDHIAGDGKFSWLMRLGLDVTSEELAFLSDEFDLEVSISAPTAAMKGNPWEESEQGYCQNETQTDCNMPTMWVSIAFRDAIKMSVMKLPSVKSTALSQVGFDVSPRIVRKHGGKLPFQLASVSGTDWRYFRDHTIYAKKFTAGLESKLDLWKMGHALSKKGLSKLHKPEWSFKSTPVSGNYMVEIAAKDTNDFGGWLVADVTTSIAGCAIGFAIGVVAELDPVVMCHSTSQFAEALESAFQGLDKRPTMLFEADGSITLPTSIEYKYATTGEKLIGSSSLGGEKSRVQYHPDSGTTTWFSQEPLLSDASSIHPQVAAIKSRARRALSKLSKAPLSPVAVFRFRVGFDYSETLLQEGEYGLPSAIVSD